MYYETQVNLGGLNHEHITDKLIATEKTQLIHKMARFIVGRLNSNYHFTVVLREEWRTSAPLTVIALVLLPLATFFYALVSLVPVSAGRSLGIT